MQLTQFFWGEGEGYGDRQWTFVTVLTIRGGVDIDDDVSTSREGGDPGDLRGEFVGQKNVTDFLGLRGEGRLTVNSI